MVFLTSLRTYGFVFFSFSHVTVFFFCWDLGWLGWVGLIKRAPLCGKGGYDPSIMRTRAVLSSCGIGGEDGGD